MVLTLVLTCLPHHPPPPRPNSFVEIVMVFLLVNCVLFTEIMSW